MKLEINNIEENVESTLSILKSYIEKEFYVKDVLLKIFQNNILSSDFFFMFLGELKKGGFVESKKDFVKLSKVPEEEINKIKEFIIKRTKSKKRVIITPLDVAKFYLCQRRLWLEKVVLSKQFKEEKGRNWDGEALHFRKITGIF